MAKDPGTEIGGQKSRKNSSHLTRICQDVTIKGFYAVRSIPRSDLESCLNGYPLLVQSWQNKELLLLGRRHWKIFVKELEVEKFPFKD